MDDEGIAERAVLGLEDFRTGGGREGGGGEAVNGLGGEGDGIAGGEDFDGGGEELRVDELVNVCAGGERNGERW